MISALLGTVALSYGSVPLYKMVSRCPIGIADSIDMFNYRLGRSASQSTCAGVRRRRRHLTTITASHGRKADPHNVQRLGV
jgi:hypothetical protein